MENYSTYKSGSEDLRLYNTETENLSTGKLPAEELR